MKREIRESLASGSTRTATLVIDKNGLRVEDKNPSYENDSSIISSFICNRLDMDEWKHTWHMDTSKIRWRGSKERKQAKAILKGKIETRESEIALLRDAINVLQHFH